MRTPKKNPLTNIILTVLVAVAVLALAGVSLAGNGKGNGGNGNAGGKGKGHDPGASQSSANKQYGSAGKQYGLHRVVLCHKGHTIKVAPPAVKAHLRHGDKLGAC
jgi:hypothetical protein